jgi:hypothetical protein
MMSSHGTSSVSEHHWFAKAWGSGDQAALDQLTPAIYLELRRIARQHMRREYRITRFSNGIRANPQRESRAR